MYFLAVVIGFNPEDYSVDENDGTVQVFVSVLQGSIPAGETRRVTISTEDGTAGGNPYLMNPLINNHSSHINYNCIMESPG